MRSVRDAGLKLHQLVSVFVHRLVHLYLHFDAEIRIGRHYRLGREYTHIRFEYRTQLPTTAVWGFRQNCRRVYICRGTPIASNIVDDPGSNSAADIPVTEEVMRLW